MPEVTFEPNARPGEAFDSAVHGFDKAQSWMSQMQQRRQREQAMRFDEEDQQKKNAIFAVTLPLQVAQAKAAAAQAQNDYAGDLQMQSLMAQAQTEMPNIRSEWTKTFQMPDQNERLAAQDAILSNAGRYASLKNVGPEITVWRDIYAKAQLDKRTQDLITGRSEAATIQAQARQEIANAQLQMKAEMEKQRQAHQNELEQLKGEINMKRDAAKATTYQSSAAFKIREGAASKFNEELVKSAMAANYEKAQAERGLQLLEVARTGTGAEAENAIKRIGTLFGGDTESVKNYEQLQGILGNQIFDYIHRTKGAISDREMETFKRYAANTEKSPEGNRAILQALIKAKERDIALGAQINEMRKEGDREADIQNAVVEFQNANPIFSDIKPSSGGSGLKILSIKKIE